MKKYFFILAPIVFLFLTTCNLPVMPDSESESDTTNVGEKTLDRPLYKMKYYSDWHVDTTGEDENIDSYFCIDSKSNDGVMIFFIFNTATDEAVNVDNQVKAQLEKSMKDGKVTYFEKWGNYKGHGALMRGRILGIFKSELRIFSYSNDSCSFIAVSQMNDSDRKTDARGYQLIEKTFKLKE